MSLLTLIQDVCGQVGMPQPTSVIGSSSGHVKKMLAILQSDLAIRVRDEGPFPEFRRNHTMTLVSAQDNYALPEDFDFAVNETHWDQANNWEILQTSPKGWRFRKESTISESIWKRFIVQGWADNQFIIDPAPAANEAGNTLTFDYYSTTWIKPQEWAASTAVVAGQFVSYNGNIYSTASAGTTGSTAPTHTSGDSSDGGVTWSYSSAAYDRFTADTDELILPEHIYVLGLKWLWRQSNGLPSEDKGDFYRKLARHKTKLKGARTRNLAGSRGRRWPNIPEVIPT